MSDEPQFDPGTVSYDPLYRCHMERDALKVQNYELKGLLSTAIQTNLVLENKLAEVWRLVLAKAQVDAIRGALGEYAV